MDGDYVLISVCVCVWVFVCHQDYGKTTGRISTKLGGGIAYGPRTNPLTFENDPDPNPDSGSL